MLETAQINQFFNLTAFYVHRHFYWRPGRRKTCNRVIRGDPWDYIHSESTLKLPLSNNSRIQVSNSIVFISWCLHHPVSLLLHSDDCHLPNARKVSLWVHGESSKSSDLNFFHRHFNICIRNDLESFKWLIYVYKRLFCPPQLLES